MIEPFDIHPKSRNLQLAYATLHLAEKQMLSSRVGAYTTIRQFCEHVSKAVAEKRELDIEGYINLGKQLRELHSNGDLTDAQFKILDEIRERTNEKVHANEKVHGEDGSLADLGSLILIARRVADALPGETPNSGSSNFKKHSARDDAERAKSTDKFKLPAPKTSGQEFNSKLIARAKTAAKSLVVLLALLGVWNYHQEIVELLTPEPQAPPPEELAGLTPFVVSPTENSAVNVRDRPGSEGSEVIARVMPQEIVIGKSSQLTLSNERWTKIVLDDGSTGWILSELLTRKEPEISDVILGESQVAGKLRRAPSGTTFVGSPAQIVMSIDWEYASENSTSIVVESAGEISGTHCSWILDSMSGPRICTISGLAPGSYQFRILLDDKEVYNTKAKVFAAPSDGTRQGSSGVVNPSYSCVRQLSWAEAIVCRDAELARLDVQLARQYRSAQLQVEGSAKESLISAQRAWLEGREDCELSATGRKCLVDVYRQRLSSVASAVESAKAPQLPTSEQAQSLADFAKSAAAGTSSTGLEFEAVALASPDTWVTSRDYPRSAIRRGSQGTSVTSFRISRDGRARDCKIIKSSGDRALDRAACRAIERRARFEPARNTNGTAIEVQMQHPVNWTIR